MALASWTGLYTPVVQSLMRDKKVKELLVLHAIAGYADPFGFAFPGAKVLMHLVRCNKANLERFIAYLVEQGYLKVYEVYNPRRGKTDTDYQVSPCVLYVREEIQAYCEALWDGEDRDFKAEKKYRENLSSTKESYPESESESVPDSENRLRNQSQHHHPALTPKESRPVTTRLAKSEQRDSAIPQRRKAQTEKNTPPEGAAKRDLSAYRKPFATLDDEDLAQDIKLTVGTQISQARYAVATYDRAELRIALELTRQKRSRGEVAKPGGYFFAMLDNGVIVPDEDAGAVFPPRVVYGDTPDQDTTETWNPKTGSYGPDDPDPLGV